MGCINYHTNLNSGTRCPTCEETVGPKVIKVPKPSGKISFGNFADDLRETFMRTPGNAFDTWHAVARKALELKDLVLTESTEDD